MYVWGHRYKKSNFRYTQQKEEQIRKQFRETCKTQTSQYKVLKAQLLQSTTKEKKTTVIKNLKDEQHHKLRLLGQQVSCHLPRSLWRRLQVQLISNFILQYEQTIADMLQKQSLRLDESQLIEGQQLRDRLQYELDILIAYQNKNRLNAKTQRDREVKELYDRVNVRRALLETKVNHIFLNLYFYYGPINAFFHTHTDGGRIATIRKRTWRTDATTTRTTRTRTGRLRRRISTARFQVIFQNPI